MTNDSRERMIRSAASLFGSRGLNATSFSDVIGESGAPRGSIYHHFPEGKGQLAEETIRWTSDRVIAYLRAGREKTPAAVLRRFIDMWRRVVVASHGSSGCVVTGVAVDVDDDGSPLMTAVREIFAAWVTALADRLRETGVESKRAHSIALASLAAMEGALILCRAERSAAPLDAIGEELLRLVPAKSKRSQ